jgi:acyl carrier protein
MHFEESNTGGGWMSTVKDVVLGFIKENFIMGRIDAVLNSSASLIESGIIDSTGVIELVEFLATTFKVIIDDDDLIAANFESVDNIMAFLNTKGISGQ